MEINIGLSEEEKLDLEKLIDDFQEVESSSDDTASLSIDDQIKALNNRMAQLSQLILSLDRRMKPLYEIVRLSLEKNEILNQRIKTIIDSLRSGEPL